MRCGVVALVLRALMAVVVAGAFLAVPSCDLQDRSADSAPSTTTTPVRYDVADPASVPPGTLLASEPFPTVDVRISRAHASAKRITYRSTSGLDGSATAVTGAIFIPWTTPPPDGWRVVAYAHAGMGILEECGPSAYPDLLGSAGQIEALSRLGYLVVMTDYQGLGGNGSHPYLEPTTLAYNVIDSVRAARQLVPGAGTRWAAFGGVEGGEAAWAAAELAPSYGYGLTMVGAVALAPTANVSPLPRMALERKLDVEQFALMLNIVNSASSVRPEIVRDDYLRGFARENDDELLNCEGEDLQLRNRLFTQVTADDIAPNSQEAADKLTEVLRTWSVPGLSAPTPVPILVMVGLFDAMILPDWTREAARTACERGSQISWILRPAENHYNLNIKQASTWLADRFSGLPIQDACIIT